MTKRQSLNKGISTTLITPKAEKKVFVIMPFTRSPTRNASQLKFFFEQFIKRPIETGRFASKYRVRRSDETFNITEQIAKDLYLADIVICDLSGNDANPNVMYELGVRLALSNSPVILIREDNPQNNPIFDISVFYTHHYDPLIGGVLADYLVSKLRRLESGEETYESPIYRALGDITPLNERLSRRRVVERLKDLRLSVIGLSRQFISAVAGHASKYCSVSFSGDPASFVDELGSQYKQLTGVDWSQFQFRPVSPPPIDGYLADPYLRGHLEEKDENRFTRFVIGYHANFLAGYMFWNDVTLDKVTFFASATSVLYITAAAVAQLLETPDEETRQTIREIAFDFSGFVLILRHLGYWDPADSVEGIEVFPSASDQRTTKKRKSISKKRRSPNRNASSGKTKNE